MDANEKTKPHNILKRIKYRSHLDGMRYINPGQEVVPFDHLSDRDYTMLRRKRIISPVVEIAADEEE